MEFGLRNIEKFDGNPNSAFLTDFWWGLRFRTFGRQELTRILQRTNIVTGKSYRQKLPGKVTGKI
jgi:hypothetical protein